MTDIEVMNILMIEIPEQDDNTGAGDALSSNLRTPELVHDPVNLYKTLLAYKRGWFMLQRVVDFCCPPDDGHCLGVITEAGGNCGCTCNHCWEEYLRRRYHVKEVNLDEELHFYK